MDQLSQRLDRLGDAVAEVIDRTEDTRALAEVRRRLLAPPPPKRFRWATPRAAWAMAAAAAVVALVAVGVAWLPDSPAPVSFQVGSPAQPGEVGEWVAAGDDGSTELRFSEGSTVTLDSGTRARITALTPQGATVVVERGAVRATVVHETEETRWAVQAGPFTVHVVGTTFLAEWDPDQEALRVVVDEGAVLASGPLLTPPRRVSAGERLTVSVRQEHMALVKLPDAGTDLAAAPAACAPCAQPEPEAPPEADGEGGASPGAPAVVDSGPSWRKLAAAGKHKQAMALLEQEGFESHVARASAEELRTLADVARFSGHSGRAEQALLELRRRYGGGGSSAFVLGRLALARGASGQAVQWFETYLSESPNGPLAEQALGRIFDIQRHGKPETARRAAKRYLARYPRGAYASLARSVLAR
ncbi:MAG: FecR domain-containing protein [Deltaproteobacteria bacterium]|jgi:TolA-binding protein|nr:FecR domain-containing protein [Deltaproteobacteria bacterium]MBW2533565.1 FecR domain-containing protein [Deltaproteobacteria bacterium]